MVFAIHSRSISTEPVFLRISESAAATTPSRVQLADIFTAAVSTSTAQSSLQNREIVSLSNFWNDPFDVFIGGMWGVLFLFNIYSIVESSQSLYESMQLDPESAVDLGRRQWSDLQKFLIDGVSLIGLTANTAEWAHQGKMISLKSVAPYLRAIGFGASSILSSYYAARSLQELIDQGRELEQVQDKVARTRLEQKQLLSGLDLGANSLMAVWALLSLAGLTLGVAAAAGLMSGILAAGGVLAICAIFYRVHLINLYPRQEMSTSVEPLAVRV